MTSLTSQQESAIRQLITQATTHVGKASGRRPIHTVLRWVTRGRFPSATWSTRSNLNTPWRDTISPLRTGWRSRAGYLPGEDGPAFAVCYNVCRRCRLGWVEEPYTLDPYQRRGLATAGLAAIRADHPGLSWHTLGGHLRDSRPFWEMVGIDVPGGYQQRARCPHITQG